MQMGKNLIGVILAAGKGTRAAPLNSYFLKPLLPVGNQPIIAHQLRELARIGVREVIVVVGYRKEQLVAFLERTDHYGLNIRCVEQVERQGIAHAVLALEPQLDRAFILFLGDIFLLTNNLGSMVNAFWERGHGAAMAARWETNAEQLARNFLVSADSQGNVSRVIEKPRGYAEGLKGCGVYIFDEAIFDAIRRTPRSALRNEYEITDSIQILIDDGQPVTCHSVIEWDMNVTFARDILECNQYYLTRAGLNSLIATNVHVPASTQVHQSVIGEGSLIGADAIIDHSVVFPYARVSKGAVVRQLILTPHGVLNFAQPLGATPVVTAG